MPPTPDSLGEYVLPEEPVRTVHDTTLSDGGAGKPVALALTDRRLVCVAGDETVLTVGYDAISTVRSRPRTRVSYRGFDYRLLVGAGALAAVLGLLAAVAVSAGALVPSLTVASAGAVAAAAYLWWAPSDPDLSQAVELVETLESEFPWVADLRRGCARLADGRDDGRVLAAGAAALAGLTGLLTTVLAGTVLAVPALVLAGGGLAVVAFAHVHRDAFDGIEVVRRREREVTIGTHDGQTVYLRSDPAEELDRTFSKLAFTDEDESVQVVSA